MRVIVYGAGAIGGAIGARLFQHGHDVTLVARGAHHHAIRDRGLRLETPEETSTLAVPVVDHPARAEIKPGDVVLMTMKTQDTAAALGELAATAPPETIVACAQNGVENERLALRRFSEVYGVCVLCPAAFLEPGVVQVYAAPNTGFLDVGRYPEGTDDTAGAIAEAFGESGFDARAVTDVMRWKYGKLLTNLGNAVEVVCGAGEWVGKVAERARAEGEACLRAAGIDVAEEVSLAARPDKFRLRPIGDGERVGGSSLQSLRRGTGSVEVDYLNGEIVLLGRICGVPTPVNELLRTLANRMAREGLPPGLMTPEEFLAAVDG